MELHDLLTILSRWVHVVAACILLGSAFFIRVILPMGLRTIEEPQRGLVHLKCRRGFKMLTHSSIFFLLVSGAFNTWLYFKGISHNPNLSPSKGLFHGLLGMHIVLAVVVIVIAMIALKPKEPAPNARVMMTVILALMFILIAMSSMTKVTRDRLNTAGATTQPALHER